MKPNPSPRWLSTAAVGAAIAVGAALLTTPVAAHTRPDESGSPSRESNRAVYVIGDRVVAIRRDPVPPGAYGGHGVDYSPDLTMWVLGSGCADRRSIQAR
jgi:hypothetical protein